MEIMSELKEMNRDKRYKNRTGLSPDKPAPFSHFMKFCGITHDANVEGIARTDKSFVGNIANSSKILTI
jgi:hypothetical protein